MEVRMVAAIIATIMFLAAAIIELLPRRSQNPGRISRQTISGIIFAAIGLIALWISVTY